MNGLEFDSYEALRAHITQHSKEEGVKFNITDCRKTETANRKRKTPSDVPEEFTYAYVRFACRNAGVAKVKSTGKRPNQKSYKIGCKAFIYASLDRERKKYVISKSNLEHNHSGFKLVYVRYNTSSGVTESPDIIDTRLLASLCKEKSLVGKCLVGLSGKRLTCVDLVTIKTSGPAKDNFLCLLEVMEGLLKESEENSIVFGTNSDGEVRGLYLQLASQREQVNMYPSTLHICGENIGSECDSLYLCIAFGGNSEGNLVPVAYGILADWDTECIKFFMERFQQINQITVGSTKYFLVTQDLLEFSDLSELYPSAHIQLSSFFVTKTLDDKVDQLSIPFDEKNDLKACLHSLVYASTEDLYKEELEYLHKLVSDDFSQYFLETWDNSKILWALHTRAGSDSDKIKVASFQVIENHIKQLLTSMGEGSSLASLVSQIIKFMKQVELQRRNAEQAGNGLSKLYDVHDTEAFMKHLEEVAHQNLVEELPAQFARAREINADASVSSLNLTSFTVCSAEETHRVRMFLSPPQCSCTFSVTTRIPCVHIFLVLMNYDILFESDWIPINYKSNRDEPSSKKRGNDGPSTSMKYRLSSKRKKQRNLRTILQDIKTCCADISPEVFDHRVQQLALLRDRWVAGEDVSFIIGDGNDGHVEQ